MPAKARKKPKNNKSIEETLWGWNRSFREKQ
jgi:hypothetical protein